MMRYSADEQPDPQAWLDLSEAERLEIVAEYHDDLGVSVADPTAHSAVHVAVENQVALGDAASVPETMERLICEGLSRHEAIHAIGSILMEIMTDAVRDPGDERNLTELFNRRLSALSAQSWLSQER